MALGGVGPLDSNDNLPWTKLRGNENGLTFLHGGNLTAMNKSGEEYVGE